jgi:hypothetical protein
MSGEEGEGEAALMAGNMDVRSGWMCWICVGAEGDDGAPSDGSAVLRDETGAGRIKRTCESRWRSIARSEAETPKSRSWVAGSTVMSKGWAAP